MAMALGKHVFVQKPLTHTVWEARQLALAARKYKVATQMGNQGHSEDGVRRACEIIWSGPSARCASAIAGRTARPGLRAASRA